MWMLNILLDDTVIKINIQIYCNKDKQIIQGWVWLLNTIIFIQAATKQYLTLNIWNLGSKTTSFFHIDVTLVAMRNKRQMTLWISGSTETVLETRVLNIFSPLANKNYFEKWAKTLCLMYHPGWPNATGAFDRKTGWENEENKWGTFISVTFVLVLLIWNH